MAKFRLQRLKGGRKHVVHTDSAADYLRCLVDEMAAGFNVLCHVSVTEGEAGLMRVEIASAAEAALLDRASEFRFGQFGDDLDHVFRSFYEADVVASTPQVRAWQVRHRRGMPWI